MPMLISCGEKGWTNMERLACARVLLHNNLKQGRHLTTPKTCVPADPALHLGRCAANRVLLSPCLGDRDCKSIALRPGRTAGACWARPRCRVSKASRISKVEVLNTLLLLNSNRAERFGLHQCTGRDTRRELAPRRLYLPLRLGKQRSSSPSQHCICTK